MGKKIHPKLDRRIRNENLPPSPIHLKYIFPAGGLLESSPNTFVKKSEIKKPMIFASLEGALCRAS